MRFLFFRISSLGINEFYITGSSIDDTNKVGTSIDSISFMQFIFLYKSCMLS